MGYVAEFGMSLFGMIQGIGCHHCCTTETHVLQESEAERALADLYGK